MPARGFLTQGQQESLQQAVRESADKHLRERALMLLLMNDGKTYQEISTFLGCAYRSVAYWCVHGDADNLESLKDKREQGNHRKATELYVELLLDVLEKEPSELGYEFVRWSGERLATYMAEPEVLNLKILRIVAKLCVGIDDTKFDQLLTLFSINQGCRWDKTPRL